MSSRNDQNIILWRRIAQVAAIFIIIVSALLLINYLQYNRIDPVNTELINSLVLKLNESPDDIQLREQIRELDLLSRKAYFTNRWQVRTGGYILLILIGVLVISLQVIRSYSPKNVSLDDVQNPFTQNKKAQKWITWSGLTLVIIALITAYLTHNALGKLPEPVYNQTKEIATVITNEEKVLEIEETFNDTIAEVELPEDVEEMIQITDKQKPEKQNIKQTEKNTEKSIAQDKPKPKPKSEQKAIKKNTIPDYDEIISNQGMFRGPFGDGISYQKNVPQNWNAESGENIVWKTRIPIHGYNSPVVWGNRVFMTGATPDKRVVYCLDTKNGDILWSYDVKNVPGSPEVSPKTTDDTGLAAPTAATDGQQIFAIFGNGDVVALDMAGNLIWNRNMGDTDNHYGDASSLILYKDILIIQYDTKKAQRIIGLDKLTGKEVWETNRDVKISWASPVLINYTTKPEVILAADPGVASYDPSNGKENWTMDCVFGEVGPSVAYSDNIVFATNEYATLAAIKIGETPEILWESDYYLSDISSPVAYNGLLFLATSYGSVVCHDAYTGDVYWEQEFDNGFYSSPMIADGNVYLMDIEGNMYIFKAEKVFELLAESQIGESAMTTPAFKDGKIFIRSNGNLFCIGK
jgi:outer membrane protein assembly factor BamB